MSGVEQRFEDKYIPEPMSGCWLWTAYVAPSGYGKISVNYVSKYAHRLSYEFANGKIDSGACVLHKCDNRICVNPDHLFLGSREENNLDRVKKGRSNGPKGERNASSKLSRVQVEEIFYSKSNINELTKKYDVKKCQIYAIKGKRAWKHITKHL